MSAQYTGAKAASGLSLARRTPGGVRQGDSPGFPRQAVEVEEAAALRGLLEADTFDPLPGSPGGRLRSGNGWAAWLRKEALLLGRQQSGSDEAGPDERDHGGETFTAGESLPRIAGYELKRQIGRGGSATVYLAREIKHDRLVALKVLHSTLAASLQAERFLREISIIARLSHPNILPLLDSGSVGDSLYYVMPYVAGESLRDRLNRGPLSAGEAIRLAREVAEALEHAHRQGVIHRDVKPENILLSDGRALVADFGIARAVSVAADDRLTMADLTPGTPRYMSPEQAAGARQIDGRSDVYSLGCVLYEMLSGWPPFDGTVQELMGQHISAPVPALTAPGINRRLQSIVTKALAKHPDERFARAAELAVALAGDGSRLVEWPAPSRRTMRRVLGALGIIVLGVGSVRTAATPEPLPVWHRLLIGFGATRLQLDTTLIVVAGTDDAPITAEAVLRMQRALAHWKELSVEGTPAIVAAAGRDGPSSSQGIERAAITLRAGRIIRVGSSVTDDSIVLRASLYDSRLSERLASSTVVSGVELTDAVAATLADSLVFRTGVPRGRTGGVSGTNSLIARQTYFRAHTALANGDFAFADTLFARAIVRDPGYPQALAWLSALRSWAIPKTQSWQELPRQAIARRTGLAPGDSIVLDAMLAASDKDVMKSCARWNELVAMRQDDFASWYGLGSCLRSDSIVVPDNTWRYGWRFRSSYHAAILAFERAFRLQPAVLQGVGGRRDALGELRALMLTSSGVLVYGWTAQPESKAFKGYPIWQGDSLVIVPLSGSMVLAGLSDESIRDAIMRQRGRFRDLALAWRDAFPLSANALELHAIALEMLGDESSLDTLRRARALAREPEDRQRMGASEVLMRLKFSIPGDLAGLEAARMLADSLLREFPAAALTDARPFAALAALLGRAGTAASYARREDGGSRNESLARIGPALLAFSALGGPPDSIRQLEEAVRRAIDNVDLARQQSARVEWPMRAAVLAFPEVRLTSLPDSGETGLRAGDLIVSAWRRDTLRRDAILNEIQSARRQQGLRPADVSADALLQEASALAVSGSPDRAIEWLDPTLRGLTLAASQDLASARRTGPLVRAMVLRADLAAQSGDSVTARIWARVVSVLWRNADPFLQPTVRRMHALTR